MKGLGILICIAGTIGAILFPPLQLLGIRGGWSFILADQGFGTRSYNFIDTGTLLIELLIINGIGLGLFFYSRTRSRSV